MIDHNAALARQPGAVVQSRQGSEGGYVVPHPHVLGRTATWYRVPWELVPGRWCGPSRVCPTPPLHPPARRPTEPGRRISPGLVSDRWNDPPGRRPVVHRVEVRSAKARAASQGRHAPPCGKCGRHALMALPGAGGPGATTCDCQERTFCHVGISGTGS